MKETKAMKRRPAPEAQPARRMPGFTAEASIYTAKSYNNTDLGMGSLGGESVIPQAFGCKTIGPCIPFIRKRLRCCVFPPGCKMVSC